eukprot:1157198-Pelagomonas_calceolata.AAC.7
MHLRLICPPPFPSPSTAHTLATQATHIPKETHARTQAGTHLRPRTARLEPTGHLAPGRLSLPLCSRAPDGH